MDDALERFAANLKQLRVACDMTQEDLAHAAGLHVTALSKIERADRAPRFPTVVALAAALNVPAGRLFEGIPSAGGRRDPRVEVARDACDG